MKIFLPVLSCLLLAIAHSAAAAADDPALNLSWDHCGESGSAARTFACDTNLGYDVFVASLVVPPHGVPPFESTFLVLVFDFDSDVYPAWWSMGMPSDCGPTSLYGSLRSDSVSGCVNYWRTANVSFRPSANVHVVSRGLVLEITGAPSQIWWPGEEVFLVKIAVTRQRTTGADACPGCSTGGQITLQSVSFANAQGLRMGYLTEPANRSTISWNGGLVPARTTSWGQIKALYR